MTNPFFNESTMDNIVIEPPIVKKIIPCEACVKPAEYSIQATEIAGKPFNGTIKYYCDEHYTEACRELNS